MKKKVLIALLLCLALCMTVFAVSCGSGGNDESESETSQKDTTSDSDKETETETETEASDKVTFTVTIKDQDGNPIQGVEVQICVDGICKKPNATDANGVVSFSMTDPGDSTLSLQINADPSPVGYEYPNEKIAIDKDQTEINVTLNKLTQTLYLNS